jgi:hypothetical protein
VRELAAVRLEQLGAHVRHREVVGGVLRTLPDERRTGRVDYELAAQVGTHPFRAGLDPDASAALCGFGFGGSHFDAPEFMDG